MRVAAGIEGRKPSLGAATPRGTVGYQILKKESMTKSIGYVQGPGAAAL